MGIKKLFSKKEPTESELVEDLQKVGISTKGFGSRQEKFGAFRQYANERQSQRKGLAPVNPYAEINHGSENPYSAQNSNAYENIGKTGHPEQEDTQGSHSRQYQSRAQYDEDAGGKNPYSSQSNYSNISTASDRHGSQSQPYSQRTNPYTSNPTQSSSAAHTRKHLGGVPEGNRNSRSQKMDMSTADDGSILDLNDIPSGRPPVQLRNQIRKPRDSNQSMDLNDLPDEDLNVDVDELLSEKEQVDSEEEEVEAIKQDIRFTKQESVASTRNTLRMAQEAEASGTNTLGMLGAQSERLYNAEQNLLLADTQTKIADEKVKELGRLNRSIFIPATGNPFNKKSRLRQRESKLKADKIQEKYLRDTNRQGMYASEQRLTSGISSKTTNSEVFNKYQGEKQIQQAQRYQIDNDSEDDEMEKELASNLDQISNYSKKLKSTAKVMGQEVEAQNSRLRRIEEDADRLDINVHLNSSRLNNIR